MLKTLAIGALCLTVVVAVGLLLAVAEKREQN